MKKVLIFALTVSMIICPMACVNDPTDSQALCPDQETDTSVECTVVATDTSTAVEDVSTETVEDTATETAVE
jgi:hypothetical protein